MNAVIELKNVSKKFRLYARPFDRLKESLHPFRKRFHHEHWALRDISFSVPKGETIGIMGRNGAGKSTLLKLITSVLEPTQGEIGITGRVSALLELGAGFNPEMTGRENVLAQAALMGMTRKVMASKLPEIETFADIGEYIDQPVKTYSSGMFVRLAFAMFISVEPDILIIDEALAVGDAAFQDKCFKKLKELKDDGKTFVLVSHSASLISALCDRVIVLENNEISFDGQPRPGLVHYGRLLFGSSATKGGDVRALLNAEKMRVSDSVALNVDLLDKPHSSSVNKFFSHASDQECSAKRINKDEVRTGNTITACIEDYLILNGHWEECNVISLNEIVHIYVKLRTFEHVEYPRISLSFHTPQGQLVFGTNSNMMGLQLEQLAKGDVIFYCFSFDNKLFPGAYLMSFGLVDDRPMHAIKLDVRESAGVIEVSGMPNFNGLVDLEPQLTRVDVVYSRNEKS